MSIKSWDEFVEKLKIAKEQNKTGYVKMNAIATLLFTGAFDYLVSQELLEKEPHSVYNKMFEQARAALKSQAKLPAKKKDDIVELKSASTKGELALWRFKITPFVNMDLIESYEWQIKQSGYERSQGKRSWKKPGTKDTPVSDLTDLWSDIFKYAGTPFFDSVVRGNRRLCVFGIVVDSEIIRYHGNKEMLKFTVFTGKEYTGNIIKWPDSEGRLSDYDKSMIKSGLVGIFDIKPNIRNGQNGASLNNFKSIGGV